MAMNPKRANRGSTGAHGVDPVFLGLRHEHARFGRVLALIGRRAPTLIDAPDAATLELLEQAVAYVVSFQNRYHHPREDLMFKRIARRSSVHRAALDRLRRDHEETHRAGLNLLRHLRLSAEEPANRARREDLAHKLADFAREMRGHIRREDELMYSSARTILVAADWRAIARSGLTRPDPLQERAGSESPYPALARYVTAGEQEVQVSMHPSQRCGRALARATQLTDRGITCLRLLVRQSREARRLGCATYAVAVKPRWPAPYRAGLTRALRTLRRASVRWIEEWRMQMGPEAPGDR
jgi:hemerythrin-like domain-containing protein